MNKIALFSPSGIDSFLTRIGYSDDGYEIGQKFSPLRVVIETDYNKIKEYLESKLSEIIKSRIKHNEYGISFLDYDNFVYVCGIKYHYLRINNNKAIEGQSGTPIRYKINKDDSITFLPWEANGSMFCGKEYQYLATLAGIIDEYYFKENIFFPWTLTRKEDLEKYDE